MHACRQSCVTRKPRRKTLPKRGARRPLMRHCGSSSRCSSAHSLPAWRLLSAGGGAALSPRFIHLLSGGGMRFLLYSSFLCSSAHSSPAWRLLSAGGVATLDHGFKHLISEAAMRSLLLFFLGV